MTKPLERDECGVTALALTADDLASLGEIGVLDGFARVELIEGRLEQMSPTKSQHTNTLYELSRRLMRGMEQSGLADDYVLSNHSSLELEETSVPEPDLFIARKITERRFYRASDDVRLVVEVSDTTLPRDLGLKQRLYAEAGVPEYWVVDLDARQLHVFTEPHDGAFRRAEQHGAEADVAPRFARDLVVDLSELW